MILNNMNNKNNLCNLINIYIKINNIVIFLHDKMNVKQYKYNTVENCKVNTLTLALTKTLILIL